MDVTIIGTGNMARGIATRALAGGHAVTLVGTSADKADALAAELEGDVRAGRSGDALSGDVVVLAVWYQAVDDVLATYGDQLAGRVVVSITNPVDPETYAPLSVEEGSVAQHIAASVPEAKVVKAFNTTFAGTLVEGAVAGQPLDVFLAGDDEAAKDTVKQLARDGGLRPVDVGPLAPRAPRRGARLPQHGHPARPRHRLRQRVQGPRVDGPSGGARRVGGRREGGCEAGQGERAEHQAEVAQGDVAVAADDQEVDDDAAEPGGDEQPAEARADGDDEAGGDLDDADDVHRVGGVAGDEVVERGREVARPVVGEDAGELVEPEQDRRDGERDPQQHEGLGDGVAPQDVARGSGSAAVRSRACSWRCSLQKGVSSSLATARGAELTSGLEAHEVAQALVVLVAGRAALQVLAHPGHRASASAPAQLELDVLVEQLEALLAADLGAGRAEQRVRAARGVLGSCLTSLAVECRAVAGQLGAQLAPRVVQRLVERAARRAEPLGEHVDRHAVERERAEHLALVRRQRRRASASRIARSSSAVLDALLAGSAARPAARPASVVERHLAALPCPPARLHAGLEQRELVRPGREAARAAEAVELGEDRHQRVVRGLRGEVLDLVAATWASCARRRPSSKRAARSSSACSSASARRALGRPAERRDPLPGARRACRASPARWLLPPREHRAASARTRVA